MKWSRTAAVLAVLVLVACGGGKDASGPSVPAVSSVQVQVESSSVIVGSFTRVVITLTDGSGKMMAATGHTIRWSSSNSSVVTVEAEGDFTQARVVAIGAGSATITISVDGKTLGTFQVTVPVPVAAVEFLSTQSAFTVGQTYQFSYVVWDANRNQLNRYGTWASSNTAVATVDQNGFMRAVGSGTTTISVTVDGKSATRLVTVNSATVTVLIRDLLYAPVNVALNGTSAGTVQPGATLKVAVQRAQGMVMSWTLVQPTTTSGAALGEPLAASFDPVSAANGDTLKYDVDNVIRVNGVDVTYFAPLVTNSTAINLLLGVNMGLADEKRCNCVAAPGASKAFLGYYALHSNSNVRAYTQAANYAGTGYIYWDGLAPYVTAGSGTVAMTATVAPTSAPGGLVPSAPAPPVAPSTTRGLVLEDHR